MDSISKQYFGHYFEICISYRLVEKKDSVLEKNIESLDIQNQSQGVKTASVREHFPLQTVIHGENVKQKYVYCLLVNLIKN